MINHLTRALKHVKRTHSWLVIIVPKALLEEALPVFMGLTNGYSFGGRTIILPCGGKLSLVSTPSPDFIPKDIPFDIMLWGVEHDTEELNRWRAASRSLVNPAP